MKRKKHLLVMVSFMISMFFSSVALGAEKVQLTGPYDSMRDYITALEARGRLLRVKEINQDEYEATAFVYRMLDKMGIDKAPAVMFERVKIDGKWMEGPVVANIYCGWDTAAMMYGVENITDDQAKMYRAVRSKVAGMADQNLQWKQIEPVTIDSKKAPCKEVILTGDDVDMFKFPWFKVNPADAGRYINSGSVFMEDPELGRNVGTYRCQVKGKKKIGINTEARQHGWSFMLRAQKRGEKVVKAAVVVGADPIIFAMSSSKVTGLGQDEITYAGGFRGKPVEMVKCETSDLLVPAHAEIVIEGEIPMDKETEGPYGEMFGYLGGLNHENYYMNVKAVTHRKNPWIYNNYTGITKPTIMIPSRVSAYLRIKKMIPNLVDMYSPREAVGITILSIDKIFPGQGINAGQMVASSRFVGPTKVTIVVDKDIDPTNIPQVLHAIATRWQPYPASQITRQTSGMPLDPSQRRRGLTSKIIIDATQQLAAEGGPRSWAPVSRVLLEEKAPQSFENVDEKWDKYWKDWK